MTRTCSLICAACIAFGLLLVATSVLAEAGVGGHDGGLVAGLGAFTPANQIKALLGVLILLFGGNMWWMRKYIHDNDADKKNIWKHIDELTEMKGEHNASMDLRGCAFEPKRLEVIVERVVKKVLDKPPYT